MAFTFHSCSDRRGLPLVDAVRCSCESDPVVRSCPLNRLSPAKNHASQLGHVKQWARLLLQKANYFIIMKINNNNQNHKESGRKYPWQILSNVRVGNSCLETDLDYSFMTAGNYR